MDPSDYERLQHDVEELLGRWEETAQEEGPGGTEDTPLNRLIAERFEIEQMILASRGDDVGEDELEDEMDTHRSRIICRTAVIKCWKPLPLTRPCSSSSKVT